MKQSIGSGRGSVYNIIMKALQSGDKYGYQICQEVEEKTNGNYILKQPSLYSGLKRLEAQKYVESYWGDSDIGGRRHYYRLTEEGRKKIESTDFSWEDERNEIVDNFFKKSYIDENLDDVKSSIDSISMQVKEIQDSNSTLDSMLNSQNNQNDTNKEHTNLFDNEQFAINHQNHFEATQNSFEDKKEQDVNVSSEIIADTNGNSLFNQSAEAKSQAKNSYAHKVDENQFDLFSFVQTPQSTTNNENENEISPVLTEKSSDNSDLEQTKSTDEETISSNENVIANHDFIQNNNEQLQIKRDFNSVIESSSEQNNQSQTITEPNEEKLALQNIEKQMQTQNNAIENQNSSNNISLEQEPEVDFDQFFVSKRNASFSENVEERTTSFENITFAPQKNDDFDKKYAEFQADVNQQKQSFSQNSSNNENTINARSNQVNKISQATAYNQTFTNNNEQIVNDTQNSLTDEELEEKLRLEQEKRMSEALSGGINSNMLFNAEKYVQNDENSFENQSNKRVSSDSFQTISQPQESENNTQILSKQNTLQQDNNLDLKNSKNQEYESTYQQNTNFTTQSNQMEQEEHKTLNLKSIFGDVLDESESTLKNSAEQKQNYSDYNNTNFGTENLSNTNANSYTNDNNNLANSNNMGQELPRYNMMDNINLSLQVDGNQTKSNSISRSFSESSSYSENSYDSSYENNYDTNEDMNQEQYLYQNDFNPTEKIPFDKKYARQVNNSNDFEIRYLRKNSIENKNSNVTRMAKLNMHTSWIVLALSLIVSSCLYFLIPAENLSITQKVFYLIGVCSMVIFSLFYTIKYGISKRKNDEYIFEKSRFMGIILICLISMIAVVLLNMAFGMNWKNLIKYSGSQILQVANLFLVILSPIIKKILSKFSYYTK